MNDDLWPFFLIMIVAGVIGIIIGGKLGANGWHTRYCIEMFDQAKTGADSVLVISDDKFCASLIAK